MTPYSVSFILGCKTPASVEACKGKGLMLSQESSRNRTDNDDINCASENLPEQNIEEQMIRQQVTDI